MRSSHHRMDHAGGVFSVFGLAQNGAVEFTHGVGPEDDVVWAGAQSGDEGVYAGGGLEICEGHDPACGRGTARVKGGVVDPGWADITVEADRFDELGASGRLAGQKVSTRVMSLRRLFGFGAMTPLMSDAMQAHLMQLDLAWEDRDRNFATVDRLLTHVNVRPGDLVVLPEMFDSGFSMNTERTKDSEGRTLRYLLDLAEDFGATVIGGRTVHDCDCARAENRAVVAGPGGRLLCEFSKVHPFTFGKEPERFIGGSQVQTVRLPGSEESVSASGLVMCPAICYDLRFPELFRIGLLQGAELYVVIANWPSSRQTHWDALLRARAIENQAFVVGVNRVGTDPHLAYTGGSAVIDPMGKTLVHAGSHECVVSVPVDRTVLDEWRSTFPAWRDMRLLSPLSS